MPRITRIAGSFAIVLIAYWAYALLAVPWIEPPVDPAADEPDRWRRRRPDIDEPARAQLRSIKDCFPAGRLGTDEPQDARCSKATAPSCSCRSISNLGGGKVEIKPCTIVFATTAPPRTRSNAAASRSSCKLPTGPCSSSTALGPQTAEGSQPDGRAIERRRHHPQRLEAARPRRRSADCHAATFNLRKQTHLHAGPGRFPLGPAFRQRPGHGDQALARRAKPGTATSGLNVAGIESFELRHIERLHLDLAGAGKGDGVRFRGTARRMLRRNRTRPSIAADQHAGRDRLPRPVPLRRRRPRGHLPRQRARGEAESDGRRPIRSPATCSRSGSSSVRPKDEANGRRQPRRAKTGRLARLDAPSGSRPSAIRSS